MLDGISVGVGANTRRLQSGLSVAKKQIGTFSKTAEKTIGNGIAKGFATSALVGGTFGVVLDQMLDKFDALAKQSRAVGVDPVAFQKQAHAFQNAGVEVETYTRVLSLMTLKSQEAAKGNKTVSEAFENLGINVEEFKNLEPDQAVLRLADAWDQASDRGSAFESLSVLLGKRIVTDLIPAFEGGSAAIDAAGDKLKAWATPEDLERVEKYNDALSDLTATFQGLIIKVVQVPDLIKKGIMGYEHMINTITKGKDEADRILMGELSRDNLTEHGAAFAHDLELSPATRSRVEADTARLSDRMAGRRPGELSDMGAADPFAVLAAQQALTGTGSATSSPGLGSSAVGDGLLKQIAYDIARMADTGINLKSNPADY